MTKSSIQLSNELLKKLKYLKVEWDFRSMQEVIEKILEVYELKHKQDEINQEKIDINNNNQEELKQEESI